MSIVIQTILINIVSRIDGAAIASRILPFLGLALLSNIIYKIGADLFLFFVHESTLPRYLGPSGSDSWALVTGASDGIGRGCAEGLLARGFNVILHGRNPGKLEGVKAELLKQWPTRQIRLVVVDVVANAHNPAAVQRIASDLHADGIKVSVLINNVGGAGGVEKAFVPLHLRTSEEVGVLIDGNATFTTQLTRALLPQLFENKPALIINVGSVSGQLPFAYLGPYVGAKAYIGAWSRSLKTELLCEKRDVEVLHINVAQVRGQHDRRPPTLFAPSPGRMAKAILDVVGCNRQDVCAYWPHALQMALVSSLPESLLNLVLIRVALQQKDEEEKGIKKE